MIQAKQMEKVKDTLLSIYSQTTGKKKADLMQQLDRDFWLSSQEAIDFGVIDKILDKREWAQPEPST